MSHRTPDEHVAEILAADGAELTMPDDVAARLESVLAAESARRSSGEAEQELARQHAAHAKRLTTGSFGENAPTKRHTGIPEVDEPAPSQVTARRLTP